MTSTRPLVRGLAKGLVGKWGGGEAVPATVEDQPAVFGGLTNASASGWKPLDTEGNEVDLVSVDDQTGATRTWSISSGYLIANGTPGVDDGVALTLSHAGGSFTATIVSDGVDADGYDLADGYFVNHIDQLEVVLETALTYGTHWVGIRRNSILNPTADSTAAIIDVAAFTGTKTAPTALSPADKGVDVDTGTYIVVKPEAGGTAKIRRIRLRANTSTQGGLRFTGIAFEWQPETSLASGDSLKSFGMGWIDVDDVLIDNCTFKSTETETDDVPVCCLITGRAVNNLFIQDNTANDFDHFLVNPYESTYVYCIGNELRGGWADQAFFNSGGQNIKLNWNEITDKKHKSGGSHPDFGQVAANGADNDLDDWEVIGNRWYRGVGVEGRNDGQVLFIKDIPYIGAWSDISGGVAFTSARYVKGATSGAIGRIASLGAGTIRLLPVTGVDFATLFTNGEEIEEFTDAACTVSSGVTATLDTCTALMVTNLVVRGNFFHASLTNLIYVVRPVDAIIRNNTALLDPTTYQSPTVTGAIQILGRSTSPGVISDNITNFVGFGSDISGEIAENNSELTVSEAAYEAVFEDAQFGDALTDPATQYAIATGTTEDNASPKRGAHQDYVDYDARTTNFPSDEVDATFTFTDDASDASNLTTYTFAAQTLDATADHQIVAIYGGNGSTAARTISSVTVDGQAAAPLAFHEIFSGGNYRQIALYIAPGNGDASGDIVVQWSGAQAFCAVAWGGASDLNSTTPTNAAYDDDGTTLSQSVDVSAGGFAVAAAFATNNTTCTWAGLTERVDAVIPTDLRCYTMASDNFASAQTGLTVSATFAATNAIDLMVIAAMR